MDNVTITKKKTALVLVNVGTPDSATVPAVRRYLSSFLNDKRVIDLPWLGRKLLVNFIIVPFRSPKSTRLYQKLFNKKGSPLLYNLIQLRDKLTNYVPANVKVFGTMRYCNPSLGKLMDELKEETYEQIIVVPLFPQYASSTTGTINEFVIEKVKSWNSIPELKLVGQFYNNPLFIEAFAERINSYNPNEYDHILFSYHGLPLRQIQKNHPKVAQQTCTCQQKLPEHGALCYKATCYETTRLLIDKLQLNKDKTSTAFQSRLTNNWLSPFADKEIANMPQQGIKKVLVVAPAFVADCLETTIEIQDEYQELFIENGGVKLTLVESLNDSDTWAKALANIVFSA